MTNEYKFSRLCCIYRVGAIARYYRNKISEGTALEIETLLARLPRRALAISSEIDIKHGEDFLTSIIAARDAVLDCLQEADRGRGRPTIPILKY